MAEVDRSFVVSDMSATRGADTATIRVTLTQLNDDFIPPKVGEDVNVLGVDCRVDSINLITSHPFKEYSLSLSVNEIPGSDGKWTASFSVDEVEVTARELFEAGVPYETVGSPFGEIDPTPKEVGDLVLITSATWSDAAGLVRGGGTTVTTTSTPAFVLTATSPDGPDDITTYTYTTKAKGLRGRLSINWTNVSTPNVDIPMGVPVSYGIGGLGLTQRNVTGSVDREVSEVGSGADLRMAERFNVSLTYDLGIYTYHPVSDSGQT